MAESFIKSIPLWIKIVFGIILLAVISNIFEPSNKQVNTQVPSPEVKKLTDTEHLAEAKKALDDGYAPSKDMMKTRWGNVSGAKKHILLIKNTSPEFAESRVLLKEVQRRETEIEKAAKIVAAKLMIEQRKQFVKNYEITLLDQGMDVYVSTYGKDNTILKLKFVLFSRPLVHKLINDETAMTNLRNLGFKKLILTDGYNSTWSIDL